jgi:signal transduction histidine kinase
MLKKLQLEGQTHLLSFLTHTIRNTVSGGPQTVEQTLRLVRNHLGEEYQNASLYKAINNIAKVNANFNAITNMLDTFKLLVKSPEDFQTSWNEDLGGRVDQNYLLGIVLKQVLNRICFEEQHSKQFKRLITLQSKYTIKKIKQSFLSIILTSESDAEIFAQISAWLKEYFPVIEIKNSGKPLYFNLSGVRFNFFFAVISEIVYNALKYSDGIIWLEWKVTNDQSLVSCRNPFSEVSRERSGSQQGLGFIENLMKLIDGASINIDVSGDTNFLVKFYTKNLFNGDE